jgi:endonuclease YncB( thermonuclease family)
MKYLTLAVALCAASPALAQPPGWTEPLTSLRAIDGDTLDAGPGRPHIRLAAIDAPELKQICSRPDRSMYDCGAVSKWALQALLDGARERGWTISCHYDSTDRYGRAIATCSTSQGHDLGGILVRSGMAIPYYKYGGERYIPQYRHAVVMHEGMHNGTFDEPEAWRHAVAALKEKGVIPLRQ